MTKVQTEKRKMDKSFESVFVFFDWVIYAVALTLVFLVFIMRAYTIPTGSMADTLKGAHFRLRCVQCGFRYDYDFRRDAYKISDASTPSEYMPIVPGRPQCPSCGCYHKVFERRYGGILDYPSELRAPVIKGDRIFVLKCIYQFFEPNRWDVIVFNPPLQPKINYIKRLVALPGETVQIIDGDVYIDGKIARKPQRVQKELWMPVFNNDYQPAKPDHGVFNGHTWSQPFRNDEGSNWELNGSSGTVFKLYAKTDEINTIVYDTNTGNDFRAAYAYDYQGPREKLPICSDLKISFNVLAPGYNGSVGAALSKYGIEYRGTVDVNGSMSIKKIAIDGYINQVAEKTFDPYREGSPPGGIVNFSFANVDHELILKYGDTELKFDLGRGRADAGQINEQMPVVSISGSGTLELSHIRIDKDKYYYDKIGDHEILRAGPDSPFSLGEDEFFVLGDNSPASADSRLWDEPGKGNNGRIYRDGVVPRDYLIGKAFVVFWSGGQPIFDRSSIKLMPYVSGLKLIAGGAY
ncbi:MAG: signal peptidase I [Sedimentisphaerales bacterium]|nr:signal peptidase I [Sedimentisphaerales bacterium]